MVKDLVSWFLLLAFLAFLGTVIWQILPAMSVG